MSNVAPEKGARRLGLAGFYATAVAFGPARNGYGLFLPYFREEFELSTGLLGLIAIGLYAGYLFALTAVGLFAARVGPRPPVLIGLLSAAVGMKLVALAPNVYALAAGVILAGMSAGWSWAPYNDAVERVVQPRYRDRVLSVVSGGVGGVGAGVRPRPEVADEGGPGGHPGVQGVLRAAPRIGEGSPKRKPWLGRGGGGIDLRIIDLDFRNARLEGYFARNFDPAALVVQRNYVRRRGGPGSLRRKATTRGRWRSSGTRRPATRQRT